MPSIHTRSLPFNAKKNIPDIINTIRGKDFYLIGTVCSNTYGSIKSKVELYKSRESRG